MSDSLSETYTEMLANKTISRVEHHFYGVVEISFTDGTTATFSPSGTPPTIFIAVDQKAPKLMAKVHASQPA